MPTFADAVQIVSPSYVGPNTTAIRVEIVTAAAADSSGGRLPNLLLDRLRSLFVATDSDANASPAIRVQFVSPVATNTTGPGRMPASLDSLMRAMFTASDQAISDGAPALRVQFV